MSGPGFRLAASLATCCLLSTAANANPEATRSSELSPWVRAALHQQSTGEVYREASTKLREDLARDEIERRESALERADQTQRREDRALGGLTAGPRPTPLLEFDRSQQTLRRLERRRALSGIREAKQELRNDQIQDDLARTRQREQFVRRTERLLQRDALTNAGAGSGRRALRRYQRDRGLEDQLRQTDRFVNDR
jgi:hypothetical protein